MTDDVNLNLPPEDTTKDRLFKLLLGTAASFVATRLVESAYDSFVKNRRSK